MSGYGGLCKISCLVRRNVGIWEREINGSIEREVEEEKRGKRGCFFKKIEGGGMSNFVVKDNNKKSDV